MNGRKARIVVDLGFGDAGKGSLVDFLARIHAGGATVVRFNGGAQAGHNVVTPDGRHHTFSQFGSGTFVPGVKTHLSRFMLIDANALTNEAEHLLELGVNDALERLTVDAKAMVVTPYHKLANRIREVLRGGGRHGSCGMGIGEAMSDSINEPELTIRMEDISRPEVTYRKARAIQQLKLEEFRRHLEQLERHPLVGEKAVHYLTDPSSASLVAGYLSAMSGVIRVVDGEHLEVLADEGDLIFEGAQGVLLDEWHGFHPYTTWSTTTFHNANLLLSEIGYRGDVERIGVTRAYMTRHGTGPFPTEDAWMTMHLQDQNNPTHDWQGGFRVGHFDAVLIRYAIQVCGGIDTLAVTNLDRLDEYLADLHMVNEYSVPAGVLSPEELSVCEPPSFPLPESSRQVVTGFKDKCSVTALEDLEFQERLTGVLEKAGPILMNGEAVLPGIEAILGMSCAITSRGPTAMDKTYHGLDAAKLIK